MKNTLLWIDEQGQIVQRYQKLHLFDVDIEGGPVLKESKYDDPCMGEKVINADVAKERGKGCRDSAPVRYVGGSRRPNNMF